MVKNTIQRIGNEGWIVRYPVNKSKIINGNVSFYSENAHGTLIEPVNGNEVNTYEHGRYIVNARDVKDILTFAPGTEEYNTAMRNGLVKELTDEEKIDAMNGFSSVWPHHNGRPMEETIVEPKITKFVPDEQQITELSEAGLNEENWSIGKLISMLPGSLHKEENPHWFDPNLTIETILGNWNVHYGTPGQGKQFVEKELIDALVKMLIWTRKNNFRQ